MRRIVRSIARKAFVPFVVTLVSLSVPAAAQTTREVAYDAHAVVHVNAKVRFTTLIILPETEEILDFVCGDKDFWVVSGTQNLAYVKPAKAGASTNLNLVTASGRIYSFWLTEGAADADLKLYVTAGGASASPDTAGVRGQTFYSAADMDELRKAVDAAHKDADTARDLAAKSAEDAEGARQAAVKAADARIDQFRASYPTQLAFPYLFKTNVKPFFVAAIYHDDNLVSLEARRAQVDLPAVTIRDLLRATLRLRPDRILVGEVRGGEAFDLLQALNTGHAGSLSTIHANSAEQALRRLATCVAESAVELPYQAVRYHIADAVNLVLHLGRRDGKRVVEQLLKVGRFDAAGDRYDSVVLFDHALAESSASSALVGDHPGGLNPAPSFTSACADVAAAV